jgi:hypothetical protein
MRMIEYTGNCKNLIDWNPVLTKLNNTPSLIEDGIEIFLPEQDFDIMIVKEFLDFIKIESFTKAWITRLTVGMMIVPTQELTHTGRRWHCHLNDMGWGHVLFVDEVSLYAQEQGNTYEWSSNTLSHSANNVGWEPMYLFNLIE